ncbi:MAG: ABC transporter permease [Vicinamibacterales bacterium]
MKTFLRDLQLAVRHLRRAPGFSGAAILTLALGIGATTAIFSTINAALLEPLPYPNAKDLYAIRTDLTDGRVTTGLLSGAEIHRLNDPNLSIVHAAGLVQQDLTLLPDDGVPTHVTVNGVSEGFFEVFGLPMTLGGFTAEHFAGPNSPPVVVISYRVWQDTYGGDPNVIGRPIHFAEAQTTIAGVAPKGFDTPHGANYWFNQPRPPDDPNHSLDGYMRIKPGASIERVEAEMESVMRGLERDFPASDRARIYVVRPLVEQIVGDLGPILMVVLSATALLLGLACVNVTNLLLARGAARAKEMAVRVALGAGRGRIVRQLLTESALLAVLGTVAGLVVGWAGLRLLLAAGATELPRLDVVTFDGRVLAFALGVLVISGFVVGFAPALRLARTDVRALMNESGRSATGGRATTRWLGTLMVAEIALAVMLVAGAGWLIRSFDNLRGINPGFAAEGRLVFDASFLGPAYPNNEAVDAAAQNLTDKLRAIPGVTDVGMTSNLPLRSGQEGSLLLEVDGIPFNADNPMGSRQRLASPGFFSAMGVPVLAGREFNGSDLPNTQAVAIVNRTFAERYLQGRDPLGTHFRSGYPTIFPNSDVMIVGVVEDVRQKSLVLEAEPAFYLSDRQIPIRRRTVVVHSDRPDPASLQTAIRDAVRQVDQTMAVDITVVSNLVAETMLRQKLGMQLMLVFGAVALALAAVGIYGVIAYAASQRRGEMATRLALGASRGSIFRLMLRQGRTLAIIGAAAGLGGAWLAGRVVASRLYEVRASDPRVLVSATLLVAGLAILATAIPAFRSSRLKPSQVLRPD